MNIVFVDPLDWDYDVSTPYREPLGGSQSALCYLTAALARRGHQVTLVNATKRPGLVRGVRCCNPEQLPPEVTANAEVVVLLSGPVELIGQIRRLFSAALQFVLWVQDAHDEAKVQRLRDLDIQTAWDRIACISDWQRRSYCEAFAIPPEKVAVLRNAFSPAFERLFPSCEELRQAKENKLVLAYTSTPYRGLDLLLQVFPAVRAGFPSCKLRVHSSMNVYRNRPPNRYYEELYARCRSTPGIEYAGSVDQSTLAKALRTAVVLAYPNTFPETSCIAVMEALAAGMHVVTSALAALPETCMGWATLIEPLGHDEAPERYLTRYREGLIAALELAQSNPDEFYACRWRQVQALHAQCTWSVRAQEWESLFAERCA